MAKRKAIERFNELLKNIITSNLLFSGKFVVFRSDFQQTLLVITKTQWQYIVDARFAMSPIWKLLKKIKIQQNMQWTRYDPEFLTFLLRVSDGNELANKVAEIEIPAKMNIPDTDDDSPIEELIKIVFLAFYSFGTNMKNAVNHVILTTRNDFVHEINDKLVEEFPGDE